METAAIFSERLRVVGGAPAAWRDPRGIMSAGVVRLPQAQNRFAAKGVSDVRNCEGLRAGRHRRMIARVPPLPMLKT
jgi:hypothetical protein